MTCFHLTIAQNEDISTVMNEELAQYYLVLPFYYATQDEQSCNIGFVISTAPEQHHHFYMQIWDYNYLDGGCSTILPKNERNLITSIYHKGIHLFPNIQDVPQFVQKQIIIFLEEQGHLDCADLPTLDKLVNDYFFNLYDHYQSDNFLINDGNKKKIQQYYQLQDTLTHGKTTKKIKL